MSSKTFTLVINNKKRGELTSGEPSLTQTVSPMPTPVRKVGPGFGPE